MISRPNVLLITIDSLRADHLGCYGYYRRTSPYIDAIAAEGTLCEHIFCSGLPTHPSYTTLYTGQHPITHGIISHGGSARLAATTPVLPELFLDAGYTTCALDTMMRDRLWFGRGYEYYIDPALRHKLRLNVTGEELNARAIPWLRSHANDPFFLFLHYWDPHTPYAPPERYRHLFYSGNPTNPNNHSLDDWWQHPLGDLAQSTWLHTAEGPVTDAEYVVALYDQEIRCVDDSVGQLITALDELRLAERTLVVILADHGESMTEHGIFFEHHGLYDCTLRVPFIVRWPGWIPSGLRIPQMFQFHDIAPTLLEAAGLSVPATMEGRSFWRLLTGQNQESGREAIVSVECTWQAKWSLRTKDYKFILAREPDFYGNPLCELYDLRADPQEERNLAEIYPDVAAAMEAELEAWIRNNLQRLGRSEDPVREQGISIKSGGEDGW